MLWLPFFETKTLVLVWDRAVVCNRLRGKYSKVRFEVEARKEPMKDVTQSSTKRKEYQKFRGCLNHLATLYVHKYGVCDRSESGADENSSNRSERNQVR